MYIIAFTLDLMKHRENMNNVEHQRFEYFNDSAKGSKLLLVI